MPAEQLYKCFVTFRRQERIVLFKPPLSERIQMVPFLFQGTLFALKAL